MKTPIFTLAAASLICAPVAAIAGPSSADSNSDVPRMLVEHSDLNLATKKGVERLEMRIEAAARKVCGADRISTGTRVVRSETRRCVANAKASATEQFAAVVEQQSKGG
jgi:UrcA family protein